MASFEHLDLLLGQALECMDDAAGEIKELSLLQQKELLKQLGHGIVEIWEVREAIYKIKPEIKRDFVTEYSNDRQRYEDLQQIHIKAIQAEKTEKYEEAINIYNELLTKSEYGFFQLIAEAGLYRSMSKKNKDKT